MPKKNKEERVFTQALDPSVKRYAQTKRLLARRSLSALEFLCDFTRAGFLRASVFRVRTSAVVQERRLLLFIRFVQLGRTIRALAGAIGN